MLTADNAKGDYVIKNPKSTGCKTCLSGGTTLNEWDIEDEKFYANEGNQIARRNLWASIPNLLMGFAVWLMWSVTNAKIQQTHDKDPSVYYFKDFAGEYKGVSEGYRGCPGWYEESCCKTWKDIDDADWKVWAKAVKDGDADMGVPAGMDVFASANDMMYSKAFSDMNLSPNATLCHGFGCAAVTGKVYGCPVDKDREGDYQQLMYLLPASAGLSGGIFRLPNSFVTPVVGGRNVVFFTSVLLAIPCIWMALALSDGGTSYLQVIIAAGFSGVGGGAFASSMANITPFSPKRQVGYYLGMNGGLGNLGVSLVQLVLPRIMEVGAIDVIVGGKWVFNGGWFMFPLCVVSAIAAFTWMNNMPRAIHPVPENYGYVLLRYITLQGPAYITAILGAVILRVTTGVYAFSHPAAAVTRILVIIVIVCLVEHLFIYFLAAPAAKPSVMKLLQIMKMKHNWWMTYLYIMTFGSFIGFSGAFPKLIVDIFQASSSPPRVVPPLSLPAPAPDLTSRRLLPPQNYPDVECAEKMALDETMKDCKNPDAPQTYNFAFLGALIGSLIRPLGGTLSDKIGGARVTHYHALIMTLAAAGLGIICIYARDAERNRNDFFPGFLICFLALFYGTGVGNGSTFRQIGIIFDKTYAPAVIGWSSAIASFGAFLIPQFFGVFIKAKTPEVAFFIFAGYYFTCIFVNYWFYFRKGAEKPC